MGMSCQTCYDGPQLLLHCVGSASIQITLHRVKRAVWGFFYLYICFLYNQYDEQ